MFLGGEMEDFLKVAKAVMLGHAVGDALGVPVEFQQRWRLKENPVTDMTGGGTHRMPVGTWSDDTSMALCTLDSFVGGRLSLKKIMENFGRWLYNGEFTATGTTFDVGGTCGNAIYRYIKEKKSTSRCGLDDEFSNGNGSLMRIHPFVLYLIANHYNIYSPVKLRDIGKVSALTHAHPRSKLACQIYAIILEELIKNPDKSSVEKAMGNIQSLPFGALKGEYNELKHFSRLLGGIENLSEDDIASDGYVINSLEAAVWCLLVTNSYEECVLKAVNLGGDTDTTAAIAGGLAGALYGYEAIPKRWLNALQRRDYIESLCEKVFGK